MTMSQSDQRQEESQQQEASWRAWLSIAVLIYLLLVAVNVVGDGFELATAEGAKALFAYASNPVIALIIGIVATAAMQSSSTVTSVIVGMVAGGLPMGIASPMIMGANIGTSLTSTLVSLGHIRDTDEFGRAFSAATVHDNFNFLAVAVLFPLEMLFQPLERMSHFFVGLLPAQEAAGGLGGFDVMSLLLGPAIDGLTSLGGVLPEVWDGLLLIGIGIAMIIGVVTMLSRLLDRVMVGRALEVMEGAVGRGPISGVGAGATITVMVQSSTTTTSLIVPMAGSGVFSLRQVYPFTLGCNIGTTVTALIAAMGVTGAMAPLALQIALVHLLFSLLAIAIIIGIPILRTVPMAMSRYLAGYARRSRLYVFGYIAGVFFVMPLMALGVTHLVS